MTLSVEEFAVPITCLALRRNGTGVCLITLFLAVSLVNSSWLAPRRKVSLSWKVTQPFPTFASLSRQKKGLLRASMTVLATGKVASSLEQSATRRKAFQEDSIGMTLQRMRVRLSMMAHLRYVDSARVTDYLMYLLPQDSNGIGWSPDEKTL